MMRLHEARDKAPNGKAYFNLEDHGMGQGRYIIDFATVKQIDASVAFRDDWELVQDIEVGDVVKENQTNHVAHVIAKRDDLACVEYKPSGGYFTKKTYYAQRHLSDLTLIRKGKRHVFEGVRPRCNGSFWELLMVDGADKVCGDKTYRMILEED